MTMTIAEVFANAAREESRIISILEKWIKSTEKKRDLYSEMISWVKEEKPGLYYEKHATTMLSNIADLENGGSPEEEEVYNFFAKLVEWY